MKSVRLDSDIIAKIRHIAQIKGMTLSEVHQLALERYCEQEIAQTHTSRYSNIIGSGEGSPDLSSNSHEIFGKILNDKY